MNDPEALSRLLVEDDLTVAAVTAAMLTDFGHKVHRAANAEQAQSILWSVLEIDVLFSDVVMPGGMTVSSWPRSLYRSDRSSRSC